MEGFRGTFVLVFFRVPHLRLQRIDEVFPAHEVHEAAAQIGAQLRQLLLRVQTHHRFPGLQHVADQQLEQITLALAGVAQNQHIGVGAVAGAAVRVHDDVGAVLVPAEVEAFRIGFAGVVEEEQIGGGDGGQDALKLGGEGVAARRIHRLEPLPLAQQQPVRAQLGAGQIGENFALQRPQVLQSSSAQFGVDRAVDQRLPVPVHGGHQLRHVVEVGLGGDALFQIVCGAAVQAVFVRRVVDDPVLLCGGDPADVHRQRHPGFLPQPPQQGQLLGGGRIATQGQGGAVSPAQNVVVRVELHGGGGDEVQEVFGLNFGLEHGFRRFFLLLFSHCESTPRRRNRRNARW